LTDTENSEHTPPQLGQRLPESGNRVAQFPDSCGSRHGPRWHCAWTHPGREYQASLAIRACGFNAFLPLHCRQRPLSRYDIVPAFPRYVFCRFDPWADLWGRIVNCRGVAGLICHDIGHPTPIPEHAMNELLARTSDRGIVDDPEERPQDAPQAGYVSPWHGMTGMEPDARVRLLIRLFGESVTKRMESL
jgi:hypothetical protein